jgi:hypothetical protein
MRINQIELLTTSIYSFLKVNFIKKFSCGAGLPRGVAPFLNPFFALKLYFVKINITFTKNNRPYL